jgi:hypothetical protein
MEREWTCCCCADNGIPTEERNVDVGPTRMLRDGVKAEQSNLNTATSNKVKWESRAEIIYSYWLEKEGKGKTAALLSSV